MDKIKTIEEFWCAIDEFRQVRGITWKKLMGANAELAATGKLNLTLARLLQLQEGLNINLFNTLELAALEPEERVEKNPATLMKMEQIYELIMEDSWMEDEKIVKKVQELAATII